MNIIPLQPIPNQRLRIPLSGRRFELVIKGIEEYITVDVLIDGEVVLEGIRAVAGTPIIPYRYLEYGNILFITENDEYPNWRLFNSSQRLVYLTPDEIGEL